jgi:hypothetical protein
VDLKGKKCFLDLGMHEIIISKINQREEERIHKE